MEADKEKMHGPFEADLLSVSNFILSSFEDMHHRTINFIRIIIFENEIEIRGTV